MEAEAKAGAATATTKKIARATPEGVEVGVELEKGRVPEEEKAVAVVATDWEF
jgi:hypothetical protein